MYGVRSRMIPLVGTYLHMYLVHTYVRGPGLPGATSVDEVLSAQTWHSAAYLRPYECWLNWDCPGKYINLHTGGK